jgi:hypothetical protein
MAVRLRVRRQVRTPDQDVAVSLQPC